MQVRKGEIGKEDSKACKEVHILAVGMLVAGLVLAVTACASPVEEIAQATSLTPAESARLEDLRDAAERVRVARVREP